MAPLSAKVEAQLNRDTSRRKAAVSAAVQTKGGGEKRREALLKVHDTLLKQAEKAEKAAKEAADSAHTAKARTEEAESELRKANASAQKMDTLCVQLRQRKADVLAEHKAILADDEDKRKQLSQELEARLSEFDATAAAARARLRNVSGEGDADEPATDEAVQHTDDPYAEQARLRTAMLAIVDAFDARDAEHASLLKECAAVASVLDAELHGAQGEIAAVADEAARLESRMQAHITSEAELQDAIGGFAARFSTFNSSAAASSSAFGIASQALSDATKQARIADVTVRELKLQRAEQLKQNKPLREVVARKEAEVEKANGQAEKMNALCATLRAELATYGAYVTSA